MSESSTRHALEPGELLGRYRIVGHLGEGGMAEVYEALDTRLDRAVAIKRVPPHAAELPEMRERFRLEARNVSQLHHPHICSLFDVIEHDGHDFLVMELVDGETLEARLERGPLSLEEILAVGGQVAEALIAAHSAGIVHRDIKPANIMLTASGAKLLDFGVAKAIEATSESETKAGGWMVEELKSRLTAAGSTVGTLEYISPEQLQYQAVDVRSDLFSLGVVLYEMASGQRPFARPQTLETAMAVLREDPAPLNELVPGLPRAFYELVSHCLEKEPSRRCSTAKEVRTRLAALESRHTSRQPSGWLLAIAALSVVAVLVAFWFLALRPEPATNDVPVRRFSVNLPAELPLASSGAYDYTLALSPDGSTLAYVSDVGGLRQLVLRRLDELEAQVMPGTLNARQPFFSPDGEWIGFFSFPGNKLNKISIHGGDPIVLSDATMPLGGTWGSDGYITFWAEFGQGLLRVPDSGGTPEPVTELDEQHSGHALPESLPGDRGVLFTQIEGQDIHQARIAVVDRATGESRHLLEGGIRPRYLPTGHIVFAALGGLRVAPFDLQRLELSGPPADLDEARLAQPDSVPSRFAFSNDGTLVFVPAGEGANRGRSVVLLDSEGNEDQLEIEELPYLSVRAARDGQTFLVNPEDLQDVWLYRRGTPPIRLTGAPALDFLAIWDHRDEHIVFTSNRDGNMDLYHQAADATAAARRLTTGQASPIADSVTPDGRYLLFNDRTADTGADIWRVNLDGEPEAEPLIATEAHEANAELSPNGRFLAFASTETGIPEVYLLRYPDLDRKVRVSSSGGNQPIWSADGAKLYYRSAERMMVIELGPDGELVAAPSVVFDRHYYRHAAGGRSFDVLEDGRFLMISERVQPATSTELIFVQGWLSEVERALAAD